MAPLKKVRQAKRDNIMFLLVKVNILPFRFLSLKQQAWTRMHSSRMRTARSLTTSCSIRWCLPGERGERACPEGRHVCPGGGHACHACPPPWKEFLTHACEDITFPELLLRSVMNGCPLVPGGYETTMVIPCRFPLNSDNTSISFTWCNTCCRSDCEMFLLCSMYWLQHTGGPWR